MGTFQRKGEDVAVLSDLYKQRTRFIHALGLTRGGCCCSANQEVKQLSVSTG